MSPAETNGRFLYEKVYCARGDMENRIKECQGDLFADRTSTATMRANQLRLWLASFAYVLLCAVRRIGLAHTQFAEATCGTIRLKLLKLAGLVRISARRIKFALRLGLSLRRRMASRRRTPCLRRRRDADQSRQSTPGHQETRNNPTRSGANGAKAALVHQTELTSSLSGSSKIDALYEKCGLVGSQMPVGCRRGSGRNRGWRSLRGDQPRIIRR